MSEILVTFGELESARSSIQTTWTNISREMEDLKRYLQPMVETWSGDASSAYQAHQAKWDRSANDLNQVLNQIGVALGTSNENYQAGEASNRALVVAPSRVAAGYHSVRPAATPF